MPTEREREYYAMGYRDGKLSLAEYPPQAPREGRIQQYGTQRMFIPEHPIAEKGFIKKRKLSAWNKFVKANSKKPRFRLRSGSPNLKKLAVAFRKTPAGKKKRR